MLRERVAQAGEYILGPLAEAEAFSSLFPNRDVRHSIREILTEYLRAWAIPGFIGYALLDGLTYLTGDYQFREAGIGALSMELWNMVVIAGITFAIIGNLSGLIYLTKLKSGFMSSAIRLLRFASEAGAIALGAITAMFLLSFFYTDQSIVHLLPETLLGTALLAAFFFINTIVWWIAHCLESDTATPPYFQYLGERVLANIIACLIGLAIIILSLMLNRVDSLA
ncbi:MULTISPECIES: hypothetical protein [unclassified Halomonas]|uniref:hypothetical protein n=1 Tax=unclassified Halomonas TaxID=2609666 RepID=UPI001C96E0EF|nr:MULTISPECIES: hypothetical protein [unclassified Halomonas]MBY5927189.1 hypothetical protein [Halomonas sp. DP4Y7-2]MBY6234231.1 hypothetical protein [Halomonas sp. DP4Y7-1]